MFGGIKKNLRKSQNQLLEKPMRDFYMNFVTPGGNRNIIP